MECNMQIYIEATEGRDNSDLVIIRVFAGLIIIIIIIIFFFAKSLYEY